jgi:hypothetical protein
VENILNLLHGLKFINQDIIQLMWIIKAWQHISPKVNVKGFKKCCIFNAMDETDDDMLWNRSEEDGNVRR